MSERIRNHICVLAACLCFSGMLPLYGQQPQPEQQVEMEFTAGDGAKVGYLLYLPKGFQADEETKLPLMFFLHGRGESNGPLSSVAKWGPPMMAARGDRLPYIIASPQCPKDDWWASETQQVRLGELLDHLTSAYPVDPDRVFLTGLSMGGYGSWTMAARHPDRFAAVVPICGGGDPADAPKLVDVPIWAFHGVDDRVVSVDQSQRMVDAIRAAGGEKIRFTSLENIDHVSWPAAYALPDVYRWMEEMAKLRTEQGGADE